MKLITVMKCFDIQVNQSNIFGAMNQVAQRNNSLEVEDKGYLILMMKLLRSVYTRLENTNQGIKLLSE